MVETETKASSKPTTQFFVRKLAKSGSSRYLSVSQVLPKDWEAVKVTVEDMTSEGCLLRINPIR